MNKHLLLGFLVYSFNALGMIGPAAATDSRLLCHVYNAADIIRRATPPLELQEAVDKIIDIEAFDYFIRRQDFGIARGMSCGRPATNLIRGEYAASHCWDKLSRFGYVFRCPQLFCYIIKCGFVHTAYKTDGEMIIREVMPNDANVMRVLYTQRIEDVIKRRNLDLIGIPKKYLCEVKQGFCEKLTREERAFNDEQFIVVVEDFTQILLSPEENIQHYYDLSSEDIQRYKEQLNILFEEADFADFKPHNCIFGRDNKIYIIDTEFMFPQNITQSILKEATVHCVYEKLHSIQEELFNGLFAFRSQPLRHRTITRQMEQYKRPQYKNIGLGVYPYDSKSAE